MFDVKEKFTQTNNAVVIKHTCLRDGKTVATHVVKYEGKFKLAELIALIDNACKAAHISFDPIVREQSQYIDANYILDDVSNMKLYRKGKKFDLVFKSKLFGNERKFVIDSPYALAEAAGTLVTVLTDSMDLATALLYKMALHQRLSNLFENHFGFGHVLNDMAERSIV